MSRIYCSIEASTAIGLGMVSSPVTPADASSAGGGTRMTALLCEPVGSPRLGVWLSLLIS